VHGVAVLACAPGEQHDIGLLMLAVMLRADGWRVEFLGADTPVDSAIAFADRIGATMLCISAARAESVELLRAAFASTAPPADAAVVVGGAGITPEIARELRATYADAELDRAVGRLRSFAAG
jgi:methanogenic corrinoid protein MtbC1